MEGRKEEKEKLREKEGVRAHERAVWFFACFHSLFEGVRLTGENSFSFLSCVLASSFLLEYTHRKQNVSIATVERRQLSLPRTGHVSELNMPEQKSPRL